MDERTIYGAILVVFAGLAPAVFVVLLGVTAPYGKHARPGWGPSWPPRWGWVLMEAPALVGMVFLFILGGRFQPAEVAFFALWVLHYGQRVLVYPLLMRPATARMPLAIVLSGFAFNCFNTYLNGRWLFTLSDPKPAAWLGSPPFLVGTVLFLAGLVVNLHSDHVLRTLRAPGETEYKVPSRGVFRFVACANYLGEVIEWAGWAVLTWSVPGAVFAAWTLANLAPRARSTLCWYRERFPDFPRRRKALIPFLW